MSPEINFSYALSQSMARQPKPACETLWYHRLLDHHHNFKMALISSFFSVLCNLLCFDRIGGLLGFGYTVDLGKRRAFMLFPLGLTVVAYANRQNSESL